VAGPGAGADCLRLELGMAAGRPAALLLSLILSFQSRI
jgi:hypothetical protein